jgi:hypothetical protein
LFADYFHPDDGDKLRAQRLLEDRVSLSSLLQLVVLFILFKMHFDRGKLLTEVAVGTGWRPVPSCQGTSRQQE